MLKTCSKCKEDKSKDYFYKDKRVTDGLSARCKACVKEVAATSYFKNKKIISKKNKSSYSPQQEREKKLLRTYGISLEVYDHMLSEQGYVCKICGSNDPKHNSNNFVVDHCHETGVVRGLLCSECNLMLGKARDSVTILQNAINYLQ
ncbi:hypothetical protein [Synechococcus phage S-B28]|jgi:hypothetical protein|uniref:Endonuclease VII n=1 Tax=Synechococcus phage S-B28 TaxID=2545435 RepID=A0A482IAM8_9CAUD|nr:endonuclease VII [Synechococcus phage S-B28]QBP05826.1 hypothetical protein [Synechococcus phage S-B28]